MSLRLPLLLQRVDRPSEDPLVADHPPERHHHPPATSFPMPVRLPLQVSKDSYQEQLVEGTVPYLKNCREWQALTRVWE